ncbi:hypothetical protein F0U62_05590 [Cystobacter fuscus]|nr:hypothetical protein F0U62_05590 [Cystobacter fuscus]
MTLHARPPSVAALFTFGLLACGGPEQEQAPVDSTKLVVAADLACTIQAGGCSEFIGNGAGYIWIDGRSQPASRYVGKTLCIKPGTYTGIGLYGVVATAAQPAVITNCGGQAVFNSTTGSPVYIGGGSRYLKLTGVGSSAHPYGLVAGTSGGNQAHIDLREGVSDVEIGHVEVRGDGNGGVGIAFRTYPKCDGTWSRGTWAQYNTKIHDTYVHDTKYEGMYIGPSHYGWVTANGYTPGYDCGTSRQWEAEVIGLEVVDNRVENIGNDGIQIGAATGGMTVQHNVIRNYGLNQIESHSGGITVNPGSKGLIDSNWIEAAQPNRTQGIAFQGTGGTVITNNVIVGGRWGAMFLRNTAANMEAASTLSTLVFDNNTVVNSAHEGLYFFCSGLGTLTFANNLVAGAPTPYAANGGTTACVKSLTGPNLLTSNLSAAGFVNPAAGDFHLQATSPAVGAGVNLSGVVDFDYDGVARGSVPYDLGAFAWKAPSMN